MAGVNVVTSILRDFKAPPSRNRTSASAASSVTRKLGLLPPSGRPACDSMPAWMDLVAWTGSPDPDEQERRMKKYLRKKAWDDENRGSYVTSCRPFIDHLLYDSVGRLMVHIAPIDYEEFKVSEVGRMVMRTRFDGHVVWNIVDTCLSRYLRRLHLKNTQLNHVLHHMPVVVASFEYPLLISDSIPLIVFIMWDFNLRNRTAVISSNNLGLCEHIASKPCRLSTYLAWFDPKPATMVCHECRDLELKGYQGTLEVPLVPAKFPHHIELFGERMFDDGVDGGVRI